MKTETQKLIAELRAEIKSNREDYDQWADQAKLRIDTLESQTVAATKRADTAEYELKRAQARVEGLLFALVLAQNHMKPLQDAYYKATTDHSRCDKLALAR